MTQNDNHLRHRQLSRRQVIAGVAGLSVARPARAAEPVRIAAASDLQVILPEIASIFERSSGLGNAGAVTRITYGSTGNLARQIRQGAPFDVFLAADERFIFDLVRDRVYAEAGPIYARGRLAIVVRRSEAFGDAILAADPFEAITQLLLRSASVRVAIANPEHAPYGQRAIEVLRARKLFEIWRPRLVYGENVAQATQYVATGAAAIGIVSHSTANAPAVAATLVSALIPSTLHTALDQRLAVSTKATPAALAFAAHLLLKDAQARFSAHGFDAPPVAAPG
jgi:molybdate transport system substrate-binding protein